LSAPYSRERLTAIWMSRAASGARIMRAIATIGFGASSSLLWPPPRNMKGWAR
jgi:hypothetical protein